MDKISRIKELTELLNKASKAYYADAEEIMSNFEYDKLYDELVALEEETGTVFPNSPTQNVGYEVVSELPKERHAEPMLSLGKTKEVAELVDWLGDKEGLLSWKMDGLTIVLTYEDGKIAKAVTRGNGEIGEVVTANAKTFVNVPKSIGYKGKLIIRGEAVIKYSDFDKINSEIEDIDAKYKNPRNLCSGSVRQLSSEITAKRNVHFFAFTMIDPEDEALTERLGDNVSSRYEFLTSLGFEVVEYKKVNRDNLEDTIKYFSEKITSNDFPSDGLVLTYQSISYGKSLGRTAKFPRHSIAFKWQDEEAETVLLDVEWSPSRTGLINPIAVFEPVELEGTTVSRASVHNISIVKELKLGIGDKLKVYKANMIIPQISENLTQSGNLEIPERCPVCGGEAIIKNDNSSETLYCTNKECPAKHIKSFTHFVSRNAMNIDGISEATLEKFINIGLLKTLPDIYHLEEHKDIITGLEGFGEKSYDNLIASIENSRNASAGSLLYALGISNVGLSTARLICRNYGDDMEKIITADPQELCEIDTVGAVIADSFAAYFSDENNLRMVRALLDEINIIKNENTEEQDLDGITFVVTGSLSHYVNRDAIKEEIEKRGGKVSGSVSAKTGYLINNDITSNSSKNKKAKSLGIPIITEDEFIEKFGR